MPPQAILGDEALCPQHMHACPAACITLVPTGHPAAKGPIVTGSANVFVTQKPAARVKDNGIAAACCGANTFSIAQGSGTVFINNLPAARVGDQTMHCGSFPGIIQGPGASTVNVGG